MERRVRSILTTVRLRRSFLFSLAIFTSAQFGPAHAASLDDVLARMDQAAKTFQLYSTTVKRLDHTKYTDDETDGTMRLKRAGNSVVALMDFTSGPDRYMIHFDGPIVERYLPKAQTDEVYDLRKLGGGGATMEQYLLLGFSTTRNELQKDYSVSLGGTDSVGSTQATRIVLTPKSKETLKLVKTIELWIPDGKGYAIQQKATTPSGDTYLATYSNLQTNPQLPDAAFQLALPKDVKKVKMN